VWMQGAGAIELIPWPHAEQAHEWAQSIAADFDLHVQVAWTRLTDVSHLHYHTEVRDTQYGHAQTCSFRTETLSLSSQLSVVRV